MSMLGARKRRERKFTSDEWFLTKQPFLKEPEPVKYEELKEEDVKLACELTLLFMLMHLDPKDKRGLWYRWCTSLSCDFPSGSYRSIFFWSFRFLGEDDLETSSLQDCRLYMAWKIGEFNSGRIRREGPVW